MTWLQAIIIAIIEGVTEFLPISSTAHIKYCKAIMGMSSNDAFSNMFDIVIQFAAILAVLVLYWRKFLQFKSLSFYIKLVIAVVPSLLVGLLLKKHIEHLLGNVSIIAIITILGGVLLLFIERLFQKSNVHSEEAIHPISALKIGCFQVLSILFPGFSRSAATILGGMASGLDKKTAAEFSFFLAVPTMTAATAKDILDTYKDSPEVFHSSNMSMLLVGCLVSFIVSILAIKSFIAYVQRNSFTVFGIYRIVIGLAILGLIYTGVIKTNAFDKKPEAAPTALVK
jgi:undecaprenyl-diphosphatase